MKKEFKLALKIIFTVLLIAGLIWFIRELQWVINLIIISVLIVYSISPVVNFLTAKKVPHWLAVTVAFLVFLALIVLMFYLVIPILINEIVELTKLLPRYIAMLQPYLLEFIQIIQYPQFEEVITSLIQQIPTNLQQLLNQVTSLTLALFSRLTELIVILFLVFYLLKDLAKIKAGIIMSAPTNYRYEFSRVLTILDEKVGAYLRGNFLRCGIVGFATGLGLFIMGMPFYFILGFFAGLMNIIYYIGPYIAAIPAVLISISPDTPGFLLIIFFYVFIQSIDAFVLTPLLLGKAVDIRPFTIIVAILIGGKLLGILGIILAIPFAATLKVVFNIYTQDNNHKEVKALKP